MRYRLLVAVPLLLSVTAMAQSAPPSPANSGHPLALQPAPASSVAYRDSASASVGHDANRFKFKQDESQTTPPPPVHTNPMQGPATVVGPDGRPSVDCQRTPMDSQCH